METHMILNGNKKYILKYQRKMPMKSFVTKDGRVISVEGVRIYRVAN